MYDAGMARSLRMVGLVLVAACGGGGGFPDAKPIDTAVPTGTFTVDWSLTDTNNQNLTCDRIGAQSVTVLVHNRAVMGGSTAVFTCPTGTGQSQAIDAGTYDMQFELDGQAGVLATAPAQSNIVITPGQNTRLAPLVFAVDATGGLALSLASGKSGGNCGATSANGAGITSTTITLVHTADGTCEPTTFAISAGATQPASNYTIDCTSPVTGPCIESDQTLSVAGIPSDAYTIHVNAQESGTTCWSNNDSLQVPPLSQTLTRTLNLAFATGTPGC
jgi:hypothetical protein